MSDVFDIIWSIADNDAEGENGSTLHRITVARDAKVHEVFEFRLLDWINAKVNPNDLIAKYKQHNVSVQEAQKSAELVAKLAAKEESVTKRLSSTLPNDFLILAREVLSENKTTVLEFTGGKQKALNSLIGLCITKAKKSGLTIPDALLISETLKQEISKEGV